MASLSVMAGNSNGISNAQPETRTPDPQRAYQIVVAATRSLGIGKDGKLPWKLPSDLKFFKEVTVTTSDSGKKNAVIMGRKTWESIPLHYRPLPGRLNIVLTRSESFGVADSENIVICRSLSLARQMLAASPYCLSIEKVFVIGGGELFRLAFNFIYFCFFFSLTKHDLFNTIMIINNQIYISGRPLMPMIVRPFISLKSRQMLNVILLSLQLIQMYFSPGALHFLWLKTNFDTLLPLMFVCGIPEQTFLSRTMMQLLTMA